MAKKTPPIPQLPANTPRELRPMLQALREAVQVQANQGRGNKLDAALTWRDVGGAKFQAAVGRAVLDSGVTGGTTEPDKPVVEDPLKPVGVEITPFFEAVRVKFGPPGFLGYSHTEVWMQQVATRDGKPTEVAEFGKAQLMLVTSGGYDTVPVAGGQGVYVWLRHINQTEVVGPLHNATGTFAQALLNMDHILGELEGQIEYDMLHGAVKDLVDMLNADIPGGVWDKFDDVDANQAEADKMIAAANAALDKANAAIDAAEAAIEANQSAITEAGDRLDTADGRLDQAESDIAAANDRVDQVNTDLGVVDSKVDSANESIAGANQAIADANQAIADANKVIDDTKASLDGAKEDIGNLQGDTATLGDRLTSAENFTDEVNKKLDDASTKFDTDIRDIQRESLNSGVVITEVMGDVAEMKRLYEERMSGDERLIDAAVYIDLILA